MSRRNLSLLKRNVADTRAAYLDAIVKEYRAHGSNMMKETDAEVSLSSIADALAAFLPIQRAKLAYEDARDRYEDALEDGRRLRAELNSWLMFFVTAAITFATFHEAYKK